MKRLYRLFTVGSLLALASVAHATPACTPVPWNPVWTVRELPPEVQAALGDPTYIAAPGANYNDGDMVDPSLPMRRLILGVIGADCIHVSVEQGGARGLGPYRQVFQRDGENWTLVSKEHLLPPSKEATDWVRKAVARAASPQ